MPYPDSLRLVIDYLQPLLDPVPVSSRVPQESAPRGPHVTVRLVGGAALPPVRDRARLDVFAWDVDEHAAMQLGLRVRAALWLLAGTTLLDGVPCYRVSEFMGLRQSDDTPSGTARTWMTVELDVRADPAINPAPR